MKTCKQFDFGFWACQILACWKNLAPGVLEALGGSKQFATSCTNWYDCRGIWELCIVSILDVKRTIWGVNRGFLKTIHEFWFSRHKYITQRETKSLSFNLLTVSKNYSGVALPHTLFWSESNVSNDVKKVILSQKSSKKLKNYYTTSTSQCSLPLKRAAICDASL